MSRYVTRQFYADWPPLGPLIRALGQSDPFVKDLMLAQAPVPPAWPPGPPQPVRVRPLRIPDFRLEPLHPSRGFGLNVPAGTGGSFPVGPSPGWGASQMGAWGPAENLNPMSLEAERRQRRADELERAYENFLRFVSPEEMWLPVQE